MFAEGRGETVERAMPFDAPEIGLVPRREAGPID
jgi:hypothetical protein